MQYARGVQAILLAFGLSACSPTFDWRELVPEGAALRLSLPCRPDRHARSVPVAGTVTRLDMLVCSTGDTSFAVAFATLADPALVGPALVEWRAAAARNLGGAAVSVLPFSMAGATPNAAAGMVALQGRRPDGSSVRQQAAFFAHGLRVYQASVLGSELPAEATETFFLGLKLLQ
jgi:hypothetical protein